MTTLETMHGQFVGGHTVTLTEAFFPGTSEYISIDRIDAGIITTTLPNSVTLIDSTTTTGVDYVLTVEYSEVDGTYLKGLRIIEADSTESLYRTYPTGTTVCRPFCRYDASAMQSNIQKLNAAKQENLVSGTTIKTINGESVLGSGDLEVEAEVEWGNIEGTLTDQTDLKLALEAKVDMNHGSSNKNRPLVVGEDGDVTLGSRITQPYVEGECCVFPPGTTGGPTVEGTTVVF